MSKCETCEELNEEKDLVTITGIRISGGYYNWCRDILYCPTCGKRIKRKTKGEVKE